MEKIDVKKLIAEAKEIAEMLDEFAYKLEVLGIAKELDEFAERYADKLEEPHAELLTAEKIIEDDIKYSNNGFPHFMEERTEDDLEESEE